MPIKSPQISELLRCLLLKQGITVSDSGFLITPEFSEKRSLRSEGVRAQETAGPTLSLWLVLTCSLWPLFCGQWSNTALHYSPTHTNLTSAHQHLNSQGPNVHVFDFSRALATITTQMFTEQSRKALTSLFTYLKLVGQVCISNLSLNLEILFFFFKLKKRDSLEIMSLTNTKTRFP